MSRVSESQVREIITTNIESLYSFITTANTVTNMISGIEEAMLEQIELYLAAHFVSVADKFNRQTQSSILDASDSFTQATGSGFSATFYGQQAIAFDTTGTLKAFSAKKKAAMFVL